MPAVNGMLRCWKPWALLGVVLLVGLVVTLDARADEAAERERARQAEQVAEQETERADSLAAVADSAKRARDATRDSLAAATDRVEALEGRLIAERETASGEQAAAGDSLEVTLVNLRGQVRPALVPAVDEAIAQHEREQAADRAEDALYEQQLMARAELLAIAREERDSWEADWRDEHEARLAVERALAKQKDATARWKDAAQESVLETLLGRTIWEGAGTVASGAFAYVVGKENGLIGWGIAKGGDLVLSGR